MHGNGAVPKDTPLLFPPICLLLFGGKNARFRRVHHDRSGRMWRRGRGPLRLRGVSFAPCRVCVCVSCRSLVLFLRDVASARHHRRRLHRQGGAVRAPSRLHSGRAVKKLAGNRVPPRDDAGAGLAEALCWRGAQLAAAQLRGQVHA